MSGWCIDNASIIQTRADPFSTMLRPGNEEGVEALVEYCCELKLMVWSIVKKVWQKQSCQMSARDIGTQTSVGIYDQVESSS